MKSFLAVAILVLSACAGPEIKLPPTQCGYVSHSEKACDRESVEATFGKIKDKGETCTAPSPHFTENYETCRYLD